MPRSIFKADKSGMFLANWRACYPKAPHPTAEYKFHPERRWRFDWAWPNYRVAVEVDGGAWLPHGGRHGGDGDREKLNAASSLRWLVFRFSPQMLRDDPEACCGMVWQAIQDSM